MRTRFTIAFIFLVASVFAHLAPSGAIETDFFATEMNNYGMPYFSLLKNISPKNDSPTVSLVTVGDIRFTNINTVNNILKSINDEEDTKVLSWLKSRDLFLGNLEMTFLDDKAGCKLTTGVAKTSWVNVLTNIQIDAVNLANNHFQFDGGVCGVKESIKIFQKNKIATFGINENFQIYEAKGIKIGLLGYARYHMNAEMPAKFKVGELEEKKILAQIEKYEDVVDHILVMMHWGELGISVPSPSEEKLAKKILDAGASVVVGSGPHVIQRVDVIEDKVAAYSLGNFLFDRLNSENKNLQFAKSFMLEIELTKEKIINARIYPIVSHSGILTIPKGEVLSGCNDKINRLYSLSSEDYYDSVSLYSKLKGRFIMFLKDFKKNPILAIERHFKLKYLYKAIKLFWGKYRIFIIGIFTFVFLSIFFILKSRNKKAVVQ
ncbi:hypothetical protein DSCW_50650 [Desulfosarcina widdelii]|uniref:Capsule synthesis protein CapA domain-containing protein n=1 Tax=Desulfosarcina widdelii TaxID=947919 RepID=A0A5K7Z9B7_9BACT|nr:CapA family protein [Desulfosarcina widdelii]BBO77648.1 hypothetical protein DSCW_50650 [Desulfosarcina widdelii]